MGHPGSETHQDGKKPSAYRGLPGDSLGLLGLVSFGELASVSLTLLLVLPIGPDGQGPRI